jgi:hypothetical protein
VFLLFYFVFVFTLCACFFFSHACVFLQMWFDVYVPFKIYTNHYKKKLSWARNLDNDRGR